MSEENTYPLTPEGLEKLRQELEHLRTVKRQELTERLRAAIAQGDLSENADYTYAKEEQAFVEGRISQLEEMIRGAVIINVDERTDGRVTLGSQVTVLSDDGEQGTYQVVGAAEANPREGRISDQSPLGKALLDAEIGDEVRVAAPAGDLVYKIIAVH